MEAILKPYVKIHDENGEVLNKITKENPYIHEGFRDEKGNWVQYPNRAQRRSVEKKI